MNEYKKEEIRNIHYNNKNEIQFEYGGQVHHYRMENLKEVFINCWNLQQENIKLKNWKELHSGLILAKENIRLHEQNKKYKEVIDKAIEFTNKNWGTWCTHHLEYMTELQNILKEVSE